MPRPVFRGSSVPKADDLQIFLFGIFLISNVLLSYGPIPLAGKLWIGLIGIILPLGLVPMLGFNFSPAKQGRKGIFGVPSWAWFIPLGIGWFVRFYGLTRLPVWPLWDDADCSFHSIQLAHHWVWKLHYDAVNLPPLFFWLQGFWYRLLEPSLFSLWLLPAFLSSGALLLGYFASRKLFGPPVALILTLFLALGFWPVYIGKFSIPSCLVLFWEFAAWAAFAWFYQERGTIRARPAAALLGACLGLGFYVSTKALPTLLVLALLLLGLWIKDRPGKKGTLAFLLAPLCLLALPEIPFLIRDLFGGHAHVSLIFFRPMPFWEQLEVSLSYITMIFWGGFHGSYFEFGPFWGGFLNPLLGSFFFLGLIDLMRSLRKTVFFGVLGAFLILLGGGIFSFSKEMMRILPALPPILALSAWGCHRFLGALGHSKWVWTLAILVGFSAGLDLYHLWGPYHQWSEPGHCPEMSKSLGHYRAYGILEKISQTEGPGLLLSDFYFDVYDQSLLVAGYPFNAAVNPKLEAGLSKWAALLIEPGDQVVLEKQFPGLRYFDLVPEERAGETGMALAVFPVTPPNRERILGWVRVHEAVRQLFPEIPFHTPDQSYGEVMEKTWGIFKAIPEEETYLRTCLLRKLVEFATLGSDLTEVVPLINLPSDQLGCSKRMGPKYGSVFYRLGVCLAQEGFQDLARKSFGKASFFDPRIKSDRWEPLLR